MQTQPSEGARQTYDFSEQPSRMPSKDLFIQLLTIAGDDIQRRVSNGRREVDQQREIEARLLRLISGIRVEIDMLPEAEERTFIRQEVFCIDVKEKVKEFRAWLKENGEVSLSDSIKLWRKGARTRVRKSMAIG